MSSEKTPGGYQTSVLPKSKSSLSTCSFVVYFDGTCGLCERFVRFLIRRDPQGLIHFASLQSKAFERVLAASPWLETEKSMVVVMRLVNREVIYLRSRAALVLLSELDSPLRWLSLFKIVPVPIADLVYRLVAKVRYRLFGQHETCHLPDSGVDASRFLS